MNGSKGKEKVGVKLKVDRLVQTVHNVTEEDENVSKSEMIQQRSFMHNMNRGEIFQNHRQVESNLRPDPSDEATWMEGHVVVVENGMGEGQDTPEV